MSIIKVNQVSKEYKVHEQKKRTLGAIKSFIHPTIKHVQALRDISFEINEGDFVGFIGENGAGKSTTIKIMSGILYPTSGEVMVNGVIPYMKRKENAMNIGVIFGQRSRLVWELPMMDSFELYKELYRIESGIFKRNVDMFVDMLDMSSYYNTPIRQLSLGQRMRVEIALSMLHDPPIIYLDEPTIGLDVVAKKYIRDFFRESNARGRTIILTSHDMKDLETVVKRVILITKGEILFDGTLERLRETYAGDTTVEFTFSEIIEPEWAIQMAGHISPDGHKMTMTFDQQKQNLAEIIAKANEFNKITNFDIRVPDVEDIVRGILS